MAIERHWNMERARKSDAFKRFVLRLPNRPDKVEISTDMVLDPHSGCMVAASRRQANGALCFARLERALQVEALRFNTIIAARAAEKLQAENRIGTDKKNITQTANISNLLASMMQLPGAIGVAIVDLDSGMSLGHAGGGDSINLDVAAAGNTEVVRAKMRVMRALNIQDEIEDILITLGKQYHIIRPLKGKGSAGLFMYAAMDKSKANLAMTRHKLTEIAQSLSVLYAPAVE